MKKFVLHILGFLLITFILMCILDFAYTTVYQTSNPRTKIQYLQKQKGNKIDYIFIGSSRVQSGIVPSIIEKSTHKRVLNLGFQAAKLYDIYTVLQLLKQYNIQYEKIFIQVDYIYNMDASSTIFEPEILPFIHDNIVYNNHIKFKPSNYYKYNYIPFFRYCRNDLKIGFREVSLNLIGKKTNALDYNGYSPLEGKSENHNFLLPEKINVSNTYFDSIQTYCTNNKINVVYYCAPFCKHTQNLDYIRKLKKKIPGFLDFSTAVQDENLFQNANHLNDDGARFFTTVFVNNVLDESKK
ncbi:MAG: hypothetical protein IM568_06970 [Flavobacterium sp.]|nr:hypothetical protein [Flavobacterium sp.]